MSDLLAIKTLLEQSVSLSKDKQAVFFKTGPGQYAEHDRFMGIAVPSLRKIARAFQPLSQNDLKALLHSSFNEERLLALLIMVAQYNSSEAELKEGIYQLYLAHLKQVNNWNLVDASAHLIIGAHLFKRDKEPLLFLVKSDSLWERRIAIVSTWYFIRENALDWTFKLAKMLLNDPEDLMHKAVGWMLREAGKKDEERLKQFLGEHLSEMPRTMLRYAIEKFPEAQRKAYLTRPIA